MVRFFRTLLKSDSLKWRSARGTFWVGLGFGSENALRLAGNLVLTRLLFPEAFGLMAIVQVFIAGLYMFSDMGIRASIVHDTRGEDPALLNTAFAMQIARGVVLWLITCAAARPLASFYEEPILAPILPVAGLVAVIQGFNSTKLHTANRNMVLGRVTGVKIVGQVGGLIVMIALAFLWESVWALVLGGLVGPLLVAGLSHAVLPGTRNRFAFDPVLARRLLKFGKYIFIATVAGFFVRNADRAILGKFVELDALAFYSIAYFLASAPVILSNRLADTVLFPLYSIAARGESGATVAKVARMRRVILFGTLALLTVPAVIGIELIEFLYDARYQSAGPLLVLLAVCAMVSPINAAYSMLPVAHGDSARFALLAVLSGVLRTGGILYGVMSFGLVGAVVMPLFTGLLFYPFQVALTARYGAWGPRLDALAFLTALLLGAFALWLNPEALALLPFQGNVR